MSERQLRKLAKYTQAGRCRRVSRCLDRISRRHPGHSSSAAVTLYRDEAGRSLLHMAAGEGHRNLMRTFVKLGCSPVVRDAHGNTPAHLSLYHCLQTNKSPAYATQLLASLSGPSQSASVALNAFASLTNSAGVACRDLLDRLEGEEAATSAAVEAALAESERAEADAEAAAEGADSWRRRLADAAAADAADAATNAAYSDSEWSSPSSTTFETIDDWFERIGREYAQRRSREKQQQQRQYERPPQPPKAKEYMQLAREPLMIETPKAADSAYLCHKDAYVAFLGDPPATIRGVGDVPWLPFLDSAAADPAGVLRLLREVPGLALGPELRQLRVLWHPDKFTQKFGHSLLPEAREAVMARVTLTSQLVNGAVALLAAAS